MSSDLSDHAALAEAFAPGTIPGLADELWRMNLEISALRKERDAVRQILLEWSMKEIEGPEGQMVGRLIEARHSCRAVQRLDEVVNQLPRWKWELEFTRKEG